MSRRTFLSGSIGAVGAASALGMAPVALVAGVTGATEPALSEEEMSTLTGPLFMHVRDAVAGEIEVLVGESSVVVKDPSLVARVLRASK